MLSTAIVIFREAIEIAMILGVVLAATRRLPGRLFWVVGGIAGGALGAGLVAVFARAISDSLSGMGQEFFNAMILFTAALFIGWTVVWMRKHARDVVHQLREVGNDVTHGRLPLYSLSLIIGLAILREGSEIVLFIYGMSLSGQTSSSIVIGSLVGSTLGIIVGVMLYYGLLKMPARHMLSVTSWLLILLVAGLTSQGAGYLSAAGYFSDLSTPLWNSSWLLSEDSIMGKMLHSLIGYSARPSAIQLFFYLTTFGGLMTITTLMNRANKTTVAAAVILTLILASNPGAAFALDEIYSPNAEPGEAAIEYNGNRTFDNDHSKNNIQGHEMALEYGATDRLMVELSGVMAKDVDEGLKMEATQVEGRYQFFEQGANWVDTGLLAAYGFSTKSQTSDTLEVKLLLEKDTGMITNRANIGFEQETGKYAAGGPDYAFLWSSRYRYSEYVQPGFEIQSDMGHGEVMHHFNQQEQYVGPALYGRLFGNVKYEAAYLWGTSDASAQSAARVLLEYEMHF